MTSAPVAGGGANGRCRCHRAGGQSAHVGSVPRVALLAASDEGGDGRRRHRKGKRGRGGRERPRRGRGGGRPLPPPGGRPGGRRRIGDRVPRCRRRHQTRAAIRMECRCGVRNNRERGRGARGMRARRPCGRRGRAGGGRRQRRGGAVGAARAGVIRAVAGEARVGLPPPVRVPSGQVTVVQMDTTVTRSSSR